MKKTLLLIAIIIGQFSFFKQVSAYVNVHGYFRNGTYVSPHVRSNPNGLKFDNYGWKPSQGLYNNTYGTRSSNWDTPTWTTDPDYYKGKNIYESLNGRSNNTHIPSYDYLSTGITNSKNKIIVPEHAHLSVFEDSWFCDAGYKIKYNSNLRETVCEKY